MWDLEPCWIPVREMVVFICVVSLCFRLVVGACGCGFIVSWRFSEFSISWGGVMVDIGDGFFMWWWSGGWMVCWLRFSGEVRFQVVVDVALPTTIAIAVGFTTVTTTSVAIRDIIAARHGPTPFRTLAWLQLCLSSRSRSPVRRPQQPRALWRRVIASLLSVL